MENAAQVAFTLLGKTELSEVFGCFRCHISKQFKFNATSILTSNINIKKDLEVIHVKIRYDNVNKNNDGDDSDHDDMAIEENVGKNGSEHIITFGFAILMALNPAAFCNLLRRRGRNA